MPSALPPELERFIDRYIDSVEELEILLLTSGSPGKPWTAETVYEAIKSSRESVARRLESLAHKELLNKETNRSTIYQYAPANPELTAVVQELAAYYKERPVRVLETIFAKPIASLRIFADAFKFRKDKPND